MTTNEGDPGIDGLIGGSATGDFDAAPPPLPSAILSDQNRWKYYFPAELPEARIGPAQAQFFRGLHLPSIPAIYFTGGAIVAAGLIAGFAANSRALYRELAETRGREKTLERDFYDEKRAHDNTKNEKRVLIERLDKSEQEIAHLRLLKAASDQNGPAPPEPALPPGSPKQAPR